MTTKKAVKKDEKVDRVELLLTESLERFRGKGSDAIVIVVPKDPKEAEVGCFLSASIHNKLELGNLLQQVTDGFKYGVIAEAMPGLLTTIVEEMRKRKASKALPEGE